MQFLIEKISRLKIGWNKRRLSEEDFYRLCGRHRITVVEMPLATGGFYYCVKGRHYIAVDRGLGPHEKLLVMFHEFAHYLMHAPDTGVTANFHGVGRRTHKEVEADIFAHCAVVPLQWIEKRSMQELCEEEGISERIVKERMAIYKRYGV
jgi:Zn-dependent peptidase ImmA (M78 family)